MVTMTKNISVVIPLYNKERHINRAIHSILSQTHQYFEIIVVNDGSTDGGLAKVKEIKDKRIRIFNQENSGVSAARNKGIDEAKYDLIAFLDADDQWEPEFIENIVRVAAIYPDAGMIGAASKIVSYREKIKYPEFKFVPLEEGIIDNYFKAACEWPPIHISAAAVRKEVFNKLGGFTVGMRYGQDNFMLCKIALHYPVAFINKFFAIRYENADNRVSKRYEVINDFPLFEYINSLDLKIDDENYYYIKEYIYQKYLLIAGRSLRNGDKRMASFYIFKSKQTKLNKRLYILGKIALYLPKPILNIFIGIWGKIIY